MCHLKYSSLNLIRIKLGYKFGRISINPIKTVLFRNCSETVQIMFKYCSDPVQLLFTYCSPRTGDTVFEQFLNRSIFSNKFLMLLSRNCSNTVQILFIQFINWTGVNRSWTVLEQAYIYELIWTVFELYLDSFWTGLYVLLCNWHMVYIQNYIG